MLVNGSRWDSEMAYDPASVQDTDKEERPKEEETINELSKAPRTSGLIQKPENKC
jgi:hypothetical protein